MQVPGWQEWDYADMSTFVAPLKSKDSASSSPTLPGLEPAPTRHAKLVAWVKEIAALTKPDRVHWCDGSDAEFEQLTAELIALGTLKRLNPAKRPNSFYAASDRRTSPALNRAPSSAPRSRSTPARPTTGPTPPKCAPS